MAKIDPLPNGAYLSLVAFVAEGSDFTLNKAVARLQAALRGRVVRAIPTRRDRRVLDFWGGKQIVAFFVEVTAEAGGARPPAAVEGADELLPGGCRAIALQACEVLSGFHGVRVSDVGQGKALLRQWEEEPDEAPE
ncbi:MAG TPA: hypothetical protein VEL76_03805 [Gemmataceae bacterium]|nr:hypothetical protein [Gemmataceae bacterium]